MWLSTSVEANRSWIFEVTWNLVMVGSLPSDKGWEVTRGNRRQNSGVKSLRIIFNVFFRENENGVFGQELPKLDWLLTSLTQLGL